LILPAQTVVVSDQLAPALDWSTFTLDAVGFGPTVVAVPAGLSSFDTVTSTPLDPNPVRVQAGLDAQTGLVTWRLQSQDAETGLLPEDPLSGFLPVDAASGRGLGFVTFHIKPNAGLADGAQITNSASIVFDSNDPIATNTTLNTIDSGPPASSVAAL